MNKYERRRNELAERFARELHPLYENYMDSSKFSVLKQILPLADIALAEMVKVAEDSFEAGVSWKSNGFNLNAKKQYLLTQGLIEGK